MLLTRKQTKHLKHVEGQIYRFVDSPDVTDEEREKLRDLDEGYFDLGGFHIIENFEELSRKETK